MLMAPTVEVQSLPASQTYPANEIFSCPTQSQDFSDLLFPDAIACFAILEWMIPARNPKRVPHQDYLVLKASEYRWLKWYASILFGILPEALWKEYSSTIALHFHWTLL